MMSGAAGLRSFAQRLVDPSSMKSSVLASAPRWKPRFAGATAVSLLALLSTSIPSLAQTWTGSTSSDWTFGSNWSGGAVPTASDVIINTTSPNPTVLGVSGAAAATSRNVVVGFSAGPGDLTIQNGSTLTSSANDFSYVGLNGGSVGVVNVTGPGSKWTINGSPGNVSLLLGSVESGGGSAQGTLNISNGGAVEAAGDVVVGETSSTGFLNVTSGGTLTTGRDGYIGRHAGSNGTAVITGTGSSWTIADRLFVGNTGPGALTISDNALVDVGTSTTLGLPASPGTLNVTSGGTLQTQTLVRGTGPVQVNFDDGTLRAKADTTGFVSGFSGTELNIASGGLTIDTDGFNVTAASPFSGSGTLTKVGAGTLTLAGANSTNFSGVMAINAGTLSVGAVTNLGTGGLSFDGGTLQNTGAFTSASAVTLNPGGGTFQTDAGLMLAGVFDGDGALTKTGSDTLTLTGANTYSGQTWIQSGTLALSGSGTIANSSRVIADGTFNISAVTPATANIQSLAGGGTVVLGAKGLALTNANDTFAGSITGTGGLAVSAGTQTLTGISNYTGPTSVSGTGTLQLLNGGQITGTSATSVSQLNSRATITVSGTGSLLQTGTLSLGLNTGSQATVNVLNGGVVRTTNNVATGIGGSLSQTATINVDGAGSLLDLAGNLSVGVTSASTNAFLNVTNGGIVQSLGGAVGSFVAGTGTKSVLVSGPGSSWAVTNNLAVTNGSIAVLDGGAVTAATSSVGTNGASTLLVSGAGSSYAIAGNVTVGSSGVAGSAVTLSNGGEMTVGGALTLGNTAIQTGILNIGGAEGQAAAGAGILDAVTLTFGPGTGRLNFNHTDAHYEFATLLSGAGTVNHTGPGLTEITGNSAGFAGTTNVSAGTLAVNGSLCGNMNVQAGGRLQGIGTVCDTTNAGIIAPGNSIGTITVAGDYSGTGGLLEIETELGGDSSPTDLLHVTGNTSGNTDVRVTNVGGTGGVTMEGIRIVQVDGSSDGDFALLGDYVFEGEQAVVGGAYAYRLYQNGVGTPTDGDWYLRSALVPVTPPVIPPVTPPVIPPVTPPVTPPAAPPITPLYQPGVPLYESYANVLQSFNALSTLRQRVGNRSWSGAGVVESDMRANVLDGLGVWGRIEASHGTFDPETSTSGADYDVDLWKLQAGADGLLHGNDAGRLIGGLSLEYGTLSADIASVFGDGSISTTGYGLGGTLTWYGTTGFYLDAQARVTWYDSDLSSSTAGLSLVNDNDGFGYGLSVEGGQQIALGPNWSITPQAQLAYSEVDFDSFTDAFGAAVSLDRGNSLKARLGISVDYRSEWKDEAGQQANSTLYGIANLYYDFLDGSRTDVAGVKLTSEADPLWGGVGVGGSYNWGDGKYALHGEASINTSLRDFGDSYALKGNVGFGVKF
jgi:fibronectin-binding autotransporter adhesin